MTQEDIATIEKNNLFSYEVEGEKVELNLDDVVISSEDLEGWLVANDGDLTVALDVNLTDELKAEGIARELVNRIQNIRKDSDFEVTDRVKLTLQSSDYISEAVAKFSTYICNEVLATELKVVDGDDFGQEVELEEGVMLKIAVEKN
jgi:isoleucyl-tRNA synthetase